MSPEEERTYWSRVQRRLDSGVTVKISAGRKFFICRNGVWFAKTRNPRLATMLYLKHSEGRA